MNKLEMWNAYRVLRMPWDIWPAFFSSFFSVSVSFDRPVCGQTKPGSISIHFQGAATAVRERVRVEKEWGVCVYAWCGGRSVEGVKPDMTVEKQSRIKEAAIGQTTLPCFCFWDLFWVWFWIVIYFLCIFFPVCSSSCFLFLFTASWGESSVFINREDTSISVAVMHTGWALMKTDALSVEAEARGTPTSPACSA